MEEAASPPAGEAAAAARARGITYPGNSVFRVVVVSVDLK